MAAVRRICVLRSGGEFGPGHVQWLARQVPGLVCLSDVPVPGVPVIRLEHHWPGWWSKLELFRPDLAGDLMYLDLDTVVLSGIDALIDAASGKTTMLSDFYWPAHGASGLMYIAERDKPLAWEAWVKNPEAHMRRKHGRGTIGDQGFLAPLLPHAQRWQGIAPGQVVSYKANCRRSVPPGAKVVCFHGNPRPWHAHDAWIPQMES